jgi:hypothetical protein
MTSTDLLRMDSERRTTPSGKALAGAQSLWAKVVASLDEIEPHARLGF